MLDVSAQLVRATARTSTAVTRSLQLGRPWARSYVCRVSRQRKRRPPTSGSGAVDRGRPTQARPHPQAGPMEAVERGISARPGGSTRSFGRPNAGAGRGRRHRAARTAARGAGHAAACLALAGGVLTPSRPSSPVEEGTRAVLRALRWVARPGPFRLTAPSDGSSLGASHAGSKAAICVQLVAPKVTE